MKTMTFPSSFSTGLMWGTHSAGRFSKLRHSTNQDELTNFKWIEHDGRWFGVENLKDRKLDLSFNASFIKFPSTSRFQWIQSVDLTSNTLNSKSTFYNLYFGLETASSSQSLEPELLFEQVFEIISPDSNSPSSPIKLNEIDPSNLNSKQSPPISKTNFLRGRVFSSLLVVGRSSITGGWFGLVFDMPEPSKQANNIPSSPSGFSFWLDQGLSLNEGSQKLLQEWDTLLSIPVHSEFINARRLDAFVLENTIENSNNKNDDEEEDDDEINEVSGEIPSSPSSSSPSKSPVTLSPRGLLSNSIRSSSSSSSLKASFLAVQAKFSKNENPAQTSSSSSPLSFQVGLLRSPPPTSLPSSASKEEVSQYFLSVLLDNLHEPPSSIDIRSYSPLMRESFSSTLQGYSRSFHNSFREKFSISDENNADLETKSPSIDPKSPSVLGMEALSAVLGGMGFFYGSPVTGHAADIDILSPPITEKGSVVSSPEPIALFTATPSRTVFPRGFLWDEGFHQMLISEWDPVLSMTALQTWMGAMYYCSSPSIKRTSQPYLTFQEEQTTLKTSLGFGSSVEEILQHQSPPSSPPTTESMGRCLGGWIPREMILGSEARKRVPDEFLTQRVNIANPPTLLLVIEKLMDKFISLENMNCNVGNLKESLLDTCIHTSEESQILLSKYRSFFQSIFLPLHQWVLWFLSSQSASSSLIHTDPKHFLYSFRWRGRSSSDQKVIPNTLASGLDDYPRAPIASEREGHVDLHVWMIVATKIMNKLGQELSQRGLINFTSSTNTEDQLVRDVISSGFYRDLSSVLLSRLDELHWSELHSSYFDFGLDSNQSSFETVFVFRCGLDDISSSSSSSPSSSPPFFDAQIPIKFARSPSFNPQQHCPLSHPRPLYPLGGDQGGLLTKEAYFLPSDTAPSFPPYPPTHPSLSMQHIPRVGYVNIFPLLLKVIPLSEEPFSSLLPLSSSPSSSSLDSTRHFQEQIASLSQSLTRLSALLDQLSDPAHLWTDYGLRSISKSDLYYQRRNAPGDAPYWRGPIWININYLALGALKHYSLSSLDVNLPDRKESIMTMIQSFPGLDSQGKSRAIQTLEDLSLFRLRCNSIYTRLRSNVQQTIMKNMQDTGFLWEQFDDVTGKGIRGHPFSGWTALLTNILAEKY